MRSWFSLIIQSLLFLSLDLRADNEVIRTAAELANHLSKWECAQKSFDLTVRVDCQWGSDSTNSLSLSVTDSSGAIIVKGSALRSRPSPGDTIRCRGIAQRQKTQHRPIAMIQHLEILGHGKPPAPEETTLRSILNGQFDYRYVRFSGVLRDARRSETSYPWVLLTIGDDTSVIYASALLDNSGLERLVDMIGATISVEGACTPFNTGYRRQLGRSFKLTSLDSIRVLRPIGNKISDLPDVKTVRDLSPEEILLLGMHRAEGHVLAVWDRNQVLLRTHDGDTIRLLLSRQDKQPDCDAHVEAIGYPETDLFNITLNHATWRPIAGKAQPAVAIQSTSARTLAFDGKGHPRVNSDFHGKTIQLRGQVLGFSIPQQGTGRLYLKSDAITIPVCLNATAVGKADALVGCTVEIVGVCVLESEEWRPNAIFPKLKGFLLVPRSPDDVKVLARPSWWTPVRFLAVIGALLAALIAIFVWNITLRRLAVRKSRELFGEQLGRVKADLRTEERTRLAVELHDTLAQNLTGVSMEIEAASDLRGQAPQPMLDHLGIAAKALKSCRDELRNCLWDLRSQALDEKDMTTAILRTLQPYITDSRLAVRFEVPRSRLSDNTAHALLRIIRELVVNARHGAATSIKVAGAVECDRIRCSVADNGRGFDPDRSPGVLQGHFGLQGVRERIDELGGEFEITSSAKKGTRATITIPIPRDSK